MKKSIQFCLIFIITALLFTDCKKNEFISSSSDQGLVNDAKGFFNQSVKQQSVTVNGINQTERNPRKRNSKTPKWDRATIVQLSIGKAVRVPVEYSNPFYISNNLSRDILYDANQLVSLLIYR